MTSIFSTILKAPERLNKYDPRFSAHSEEFRNNQLPGCIFIDATEAKSGKDLADFAESINSWLSGFDEDIPQRAKQLFCSLVDYITEYGEAADLYSQTDKLGVHAALDDLLVELNEEGYGVLLCLARDEADQRQLGEQVTLKDGLRLHEALTDREVSCAVRCPQSGPVGVMPVPHDEGGGGASSVRVG
jgi:hypothetical protein